MCLKNIFFECKLSLNIFLLCGRASNIFYIKYECSTLIYRYYLPLYAVTCPLVVIKLILNKGLSDWTPMFILNSNQTDWDSSLEVTQCCFILFILTAGILWLKDELKCLFPGHQLVCCDVYATPPFFFFWLKKDLTKKGAGIWSKGFKVHFWLQLVFKY